MANYTVKNIKKLQLQIFLIPKILRSIEVREKELKLHWFTARSEPEIYWGGFQDSEEILITLSK